MGCYICGAEGVELFDAVVREGLVKVCEDCSIRENIHLIKRIDNLKDRESENSKTVYEKLSQMAGIDPKEHKAQFNQGGSSKKIKSVEDLRKKKKEDELSFPKLNQVKTEFKDDLIRNYHWSIFKARRARRLTQKQLAELISESEESIKYIERGVLPENYHAFIKKIESALGINLFKKPKIVKKEVKEIQHDQDEEGPKLSFFKAWKEKRRKRREEKKAKSLEEVEISVEDKSEGEDKELTQEEMDDIFFGNGSK